MEDPRTGVGLLDDAVWREIGSESAQTPSAMDQTSGEWSRYGVRKVWTEGRNRKGTINARKERHRSVEVTNPNLGRSGVQIKGTFFVDLGLGIGRRKDLNADLGSLEAECSACADVRFEVSFSLAGIRPALCGSLPLPSSASIKQRRDNLNRAG
jgi:hypothetical protein